MTNRISSRPMATVWVDGSDAESFLHGLLSQEITSMTDGEARDALLLDKTGHVRVDLRVIRTEPESFTLLTDADSGDRLTELLDEYHFSEDVEILGPEPVDVVTFLERTDPFVSGADIVIPGRIPASVDAIGDAATIVDANATIPVDDEEVEALRIAAGVPRFGVDMTERTLVHEAGLQRRSVSFDKGCYLGQETVARVEYRGGVNKRLVGLRLPAPVSVGTTVTNGEKSVGAVTSVATHPSLGPIALATVRKEAEDGSEVIVEGLDVPARIVTLPFVAEATPAG